MLTQRLYKLSAFLIIAALLVACAGPTAAPPTQAPVNTAVPVENTEAPVENTEAPEATTPPDTEPTTEPVGGGACPAATVADPQGVPAGAFPQQYELDEFETLANCDLELSSRTEFDERLVEYGFLPEGDLPSLEERLPEEPMVVVPYDEIGTYGGRFRGVSIGPEAGNSEFLSVRHVNLLRFADDLVTIVPNMAKSFEWNDDFTQLTITLRKGHKWSDGAPFTTEDIVFWWDDIMMNTELYQNVPSFWTYGGEPMQVEAVDDVTVNFNFAAPAPAFTTLLATTYTHLWAPKHWLMDVHATYNPDANDEAIAEGFESWQQRFVPLYFSDWEDANHQYGLPKLEAWIKIDETPEHQLFYANPYYYKVDTTGKQLPYFDEIEEVYVANSELIELKVINGELELKTQSLDIGSLPLFQQNQDNGNYDIQMAEGASNGPIYQFNCTHQDPALAEIFSNPEFNRAMSLALNREEMNQALCFGLCEATSAAPVHRSVSFAEPEWFTRDIEYDPDQANAILDELGLEVGADGFRTRPDGEPIIINLQYSIQFGPATRHELAKEYWEDVGIRVEVREVDTTAYRATTSANEHDIAVTATGLVLEAPLYSNPLGFVPPFGDAALENLCGSPWVEWHESNGASGIEPPDDIKQLWDLTDQWKSSLPGTEEYASLGKQIVEIHLAHNFMIGTITTTPALTIVSRAMGNVPQYSINAFEYYRTYPYRTDQWYFDEPVAGN